MTNWPSHHRLRGVCCLLVLLIVTACTSWQIQPVEPATLVKERNPPSVRLTMQDGSKVVVHSPVARGDSVVGLRTTRSEDEAWRAEGSPSTTSTTSATIAVPLSMIRWIAVRKGDAGRSLIAVFVIVGFVALGVNEMCGDSSCHW